MSTGQTKVAADNLSAYSRLKTMILDGTIGRGEPLVERVMAAQLGVSRTPVREAIFRLEREGLVRTVEGKGAFVASYAIEDVIEIYQVREGLEPIAARLSCPHISLADVRRFEDKFNRFKKTPSLCAEDFGSLMRLGHDFHILFVRASRNSRLIRAIEGMQDQIDLVRGLGRTVGVRTHSKSTLQEHLDILRAFKARDPERAESAVRLHLQNALRHRLNGLQENIVSEEKRL